MGAFGKLYCIWQNGEYQPLERFNYDFQYLYFVNKSNNPSPEFADLLSSGFDLRAWITENDEGAKKNKDDVFELTLKPFERRLIHTGLYFELPENTEIQVRSRSGMALKYGVIVANTPGTVDEGYRGEILFNLINTSSNEVFVLPGEKITQGVIIKVDYHTPSEVDDIDKCATPTERGEGGFGSTGVK